MSRTLHTTLITLAAAFSLAAASHVTAQTAKSPKEGASPGASTAPSAKNGAARQTPSRDATPATQGFTRINVTTAANIVGQPLLDRTGERLGEIEYMMVDPVDGRISFLVIGRGGLLDLGEELVPVPWNHVDVTPGGEQRWGARVMLGADAPSLDQAPRISYDTLRQLTEPTFVTQVLTFYDKDQASQGAGAGDAPRAQAPGSNAVTGSPEQGSGATAGTQSETGRPAAQGQSAQSGQTVQQPQRQQQAQQRTGQGGQAGAAQQGEDTVIVGRALITTLGPPLVDWRSDIVGAQVVSREGRELGDIDQLVVDVTRGRVVYAILAQGGFLGFGETLKPVPLQALNWRSQGTFVLDAPVADLTAVPRLDGSGVPTRIKRRDVEGLYKRFNVQPYWQQT